MIICPNCNKQLADGTAFCDNCGSNVASVAPQQAVAPEFDPMAGYQPQPEETNTNSIELFGKKFDKKLLAIGGAAVAIVLVIAIVLTSIITGGKDSMAYGFYIKDGELFYSKSSKSKVIQASVELDDTGDRGNKSYALTGYNAVTLSYDGDILFYYDKMGSSSSPLYWRYMNKPNKEPVKIDNNVSSFTVNKKGDLVTFKNGDGVLYQYDMDNDEKTKITSDVAEWEVSEDGKRIYFTVKEGNGYDLYYKESGEEKEKIDSECPEYWSYQTEDFKTIYYKKDSGLYKKEVGEEKVKITTNVKDLEIYDSGEMFYIKNREEADQPSYADIVNAADTSAYKENKLPYGQACYYDGKEEVVLAEYSSGLRAAQDEPVAIYNSIDLAGITKVDASSENLGEKIEKAIKDATSFCVASEDKTSVIECDDIEDFEMTNDGQTVYIFTNENEDKGTCDVLKMELSGGKATKPENYDTDIDDFELVGFDGEDVLVYKDDKDGKYDLYFNGSLVANDVISDHYKNSSETLIYETDKNSKGFYTLWVYNGKKAIKVSDDVYDYTVNPNGDILYLKDYSVDNCVGDLYSFTGKKSVEIDKDVTCLVTIRDLWPED